MRVPFGQLPSDSVRAVVRDVFTASEFDWVERNEGWLAFLKNSFQRLAEWLNDLGAIHPVLYWLLIAVLVGVLIAAVLHLAYLVWRGFRAPEKERESPAPEQTAVRDASWHRQRARRLSEEGRFAEALGHRFTAMLLELDGRGIVRFHPSKTPAEYGQEIRANDVDRALFHSLVADLYRHLFGGAPCGRADLEAFDRRASRLSHHASSA